jgi:hypothetical protein
MTQNLLDDGVVVDRRDQTQAATAVWASEHVDGGVKRMENRKRETGNRKLVMGSLRDLGSEASGV